MQVRQRARRATRITAHRAAQDAPRGEPWWEDFYEYEAVPLTPELIAQAAEAMRKRGLDTLWT
jgi:hypothetical protein